MKKFVLLVTVLGILTACTSNNPEPTAQPLVTATPQTALPKATAVITPNSSPSSPPRISEDESIKDYLVKHLAPGGSGKQFAAFEQLGKEEKEGMNDVYGWSVVAEYTKQNNELKKEAANSQPVALILQDQGDGQTAITDHKIVTSDSVSDDIKRIFPADQSTQSRIISKLENEIEAQARAYFNLK